MNFDAQPSLSNDLVKLRPLEHGDFDDLYEVARDPLIWEQHQDPSRHTLEKFTVFFEDSLESKGALVILDLHSKRITGSSRFKIIDEKYSIVEIGWSFLARAYWGGPYNRSVKKLMVNHALKISKGVVFYVNQCNIRSQKAMEKLGAKKMKFAQFPWVLDESTKGITYMLDQRIA